MGRRICPLCVHYGPCKFWESLMELNNLLEVDWMDKRKFRKWRERFARFCMFWKLDEVGLSWIPESLDFLFHDFIVQGSKEKEDQDDA